MRIKGLDSLRFISALWVTFYHLGSFPLTQGVDRSKLDGKIFGALYDSVFCGPAAVIVFFVISGFCIHLPNIKQNTEINIRNFWLRRYIRILVPWGVSLLPMIVLGWSYDSTGYLVGWSIECELFYYTVYPMILYIKRFINLRFMTTVAFLGGYVIVIINPGMMQYPSFGLLGNALLGLPCWLLGCLLAEKHGDKRESRLNVYHWRIIIFCLNCCCYSLMLHMKIGFPYTLNIFSIFCFFWLRAEISHYKDSPTINWMENAGKWSYSLYLLHGTINKLYGSLPELNFGFIMNWVLKFSLVIIISYIFYIAVERPSHSFAKSIGKKS